MPLAHNGMPDPPFVKGLNNPRFQPEVIARTKATIDQCVEAGVPNVIAFTGYKWRMPRIPRGEIPGRKARRIRSAVSRNWRRYAEARGSDRSAWNTSIRATRRTP